MQEMHGSTIDEYVQINTAVYTMLSHMSCLRFSKYKQCCESVEILRVCGDGLD